MAVPIQRTVNVLGVETERYRHTWRGQINGIPFYQESGRFIMIDGKGKKHKFGLLGMATKTEPPPESEKF